MEWKKVVEENYFIWKDMRAPVTGGHLVLRFNVDSCYNDRRSPPDGAQIHKIQLIAPVNTEGTTRFKLCQ